MNEVFLDSSFSIALTVPGDQYHEQAIQLTDLFEERQVVTTTAILLEIGNALARRRYRASAADLLSSAHNDPQVQVVPLDDSLYFEGLEIFLQHSDKEWGLTDCISFALMRRRGIRDALTADRHFEQAGFRALLRKSSI